MSKPYLRDFRADAEHLQKQVGDWVVAGVETTAPWPTVAQVVPYLGRDFILRPSTDERMPTVCLNARAHELTSAQARDAILHFGSVMAWSGDWRFETTMWVGGSHPFGVGRMRGTVIQDFFDADELADIRDDDTATVLAFFREGITSHSPFYAFLNLYKAISFIHRDGKARGRWMDAAIPKITERQAVSRLRQLEEEVGNPAIYLRDEGRNAVAHSEKGTFVNPDKVGDKERIERDLPVIRALARLAIEERFQVHHRLSPKVQRPSPIAGFRAIFGEELIAKTLSGIDLGRTTLCTPEKISVVVRRGGDFVALEDMTIRELRQYADGLALRINDANDTMQVILRTNLRVDALEMGP